MHAHPLPILDHIRVASPCRASWDNMTGDDRVRMCQDCQLRVYNLSAMTREEATELIAQREGRLCVRFYRRADGTILTADCPRGLKAAAQRVRGLRLAALAVAYLAFANTFFFRQPSSAKIFGISINGCSGESTWHWLLGGRMDMEDIQGMVVRPDND